MGCMWKSGFVQGTDNPSPQNFLYPHRNSVALLLLHGNLALLVHVAPVLVCRAHSLHAHMVLVRGGKRSSMRMDAAWVCEANMLHAFVVRGCRMTMRWCAR